VGVTARPPEVAPVVAARALRGFADGLASVLLAGFLTALGFTPVQVGAVVTGTLLGSAALTLGTGLRARRWPLRTLLLAACGLMCATGLGFAATTTFATALLVAVVGTLNPSGGDVSVFLPTEQALLADALPAAARPHTYARYNLAGTLGAAVGALASGGFEPLGDAAGWATATAQRLGFVVYAAIGLAVAVLYRRLPRTAPVTPPPGERPPALGRSRRTVLELAALFSLDSAAGGFVVQSLLVLWLQLRFDLRPGVTGAVFFAAGLLAAGSQLMAPVLARRVGLVRTMVFTHLPANALLAVAAFAPSAGVAVTLLLLRALLSQMDVPARQSLVMAVVPPEERAAAASVTNVPRSLASATTPLLAGALLSRSSVGWPLLIAGVAKAAYDLLLLAFFRNLPEEEGATRARRAKPDR
jgi:MFS family permease